MSSGREKGRYLEVGLSSSGSGTYDKISMQERSAPKAVRSWSWVVAALVLAVTMITPPGHVDVPSGIGVPDETWAAICRASKDFPQPWSPSSNVMPAKGRRFCQSQ
jgi:hypothetical protein